MKQKIHGFASMEAEEREGILLTRPVTFNGKHLFVNMEGSRGRLYVEVCQPDGKPMPGFTRDDCLPTSTDSTKQIIAWKEGDNLESLAGKPVRLKFYLTKSRLPDLSQNQVTRSGGGSPANS